MSGRLIDGRARGGEHNCARGPLYTLAIELDAHFRGSREVPRPWVARIDGPDELYGLRREFVPAMNDWRRARPAWSGNVYGIIATFHLREGALYEVSRLRGNPSKRRVAREFVWAEGGKLHPRSDEEALAIVAGDDDRPRVLLELDAEKRERLAEIRGLGQAHPVGWIVRGGSRVVLAREGAVYEVIASRGGRRLAVVRNGRLRDVSEEEAIAWLRR